MLNKTHILFISYDGLTDPLGQSQILPYFIGLSKLGYSITILSTEKESIFLEKKQLISDLCVLNGIDWKYVFYSKNPPILSTVFDIEKLKKEALIIYKNKPFQIVHCRSYIPALVGEYLKKQYKLKFIFDMRGFFADERVDGNLWNLNNPIYNMVYRYFKKKEKDFLQLADCTVALTQKGKNEIEQWNFAKKQNFQIEVIPCCVDNERFNIENVKPLKKLDLGLEDKFILSYLGSVGTWYMLEEMLDFYKVLIEKIPNAIFLFITAEKKEFIIAIAQQKGIDTNNLIIIKANYTEVPSYLGLSDASIFFIKPCYSKMASSPVKQGELMSMGVPVFCNSGVGDSDELVKKYNSGFLINNFSRESYLLAIDEFIGTSKFSKAKTIQGAKEYFGLNLGINKYNNLYKSLIYEP